MTDAEREEAKNLKVEDLQFRWYNGEDESPFTIKEDAPEEEQNQSQSRLRWWDQERSVAKYMTSPYALNNAIEFFLSIPEDDYPPAIKDADAPLASKFVAIIGFRNTIQWDNRCFDENGKFGKDGIAWRFDGYFGREPNGFRLAPFDEED